MCDSATNQIKIMVTTGSSHFAAQSSMDLHEFTLVWSREATPGAGDAKLSLFPLFPDDKLCPFLPLPKSVATQSPVTTTHRVTSAMQSQVNHCVRTFVLHVLSSSGHSGYTRLWSKLQTAKNLQNATHWFDEEYSWMIPSPHVNDQQCNPLFAQKQMEQHYMCRML